jgi:hypothetical protein
MAKIIPLTDDQVTGTGTIVFKEQGELFGGFDLSCDGTNAGILIVRDTGASGKILIKTSSIVGKVGFAPIPCSGTIYYDVSGTGASAMLYEWD